MNSDPTVDAVVQLARVPRRPPRVDVAIAGGLLVWALLEALFVDGPGSPPSRALTALGFTVPLVWRRRRPVPVLLVILGLSVAKGAVSDVPETGAMPFPALLVATFSAALYARPAALAIAMAPAPIVAVISAVVLDEFAGSPNLVDVAILNFFSLGAWTGGWLVRRRAAQLEQARAAAPELAREAVVAERARIARELHDVVAHSVSVISVQAGAAEELVELDGAQARAHMQAVRRTAHEALAELRRLVGVLREDEPAYAPQPGLARLGELVEEARAAGLPVELSEEGARPALPPGVDLAAYRIVQESLTNVRRHAGAVATRVRVRYGHEGIELEVSNAAGRGNGRPPNAAGRGAGHGLIGMRERVRLYGGTLETGEALGGGYRVSARLPLETAAE